MATVRHAPRELRHHAPTVLVVEDLHSADPSTIALLRRLLDEGNLP